MSAATDLHDLADDIELEARVEPIIRLRRDIRKAAADLGPNSVQYLVDLYYQHQESRIRAAHRIRTEEGEPNAMLEWVLENFSVTERGIKSAMQRYSESHRVGRWLLSIHGIGPVISAGLYAHLCSFKGENVGKLWAFAGYDPTAKWNRGQKRPWNTRLKTLGWKAGQSFIKSRNHPDSFYGPIYAHRKDLEWARNLEGRFADQARQGAERVGKSTEAWKWYSGYHDPNEVHKLLDGGQSASLSKVLPGPDGVPMLPPGQIDARAQRIPVKLLLAHLFEVHRTVEGLPVRETYAREFLDESHEYIAPPGWPCE